MNGPIYLLILAVVIFLLWKYSEHAKKALARVGQVTNGLNSGGVSLKNISMVLLGIILLWGFYPSSWESPTLATVVEWKNAYWLPILGILVIVFVLAGYADKPVTTEATRVTTALVAFMLFIGFPVWVWATGPSTVPAASDVRVLSMAPGGKSELIPIPSGKSVEVNGEDIRIHCIYRDGHEESYVEGEHPCKNGNKPFIYATNLRTDKGNAITYSYKK